MVSENERYHASSKTKEEKTKEELQETLRKLLSIGRLVITPEWNYLADDWVTCVSAADIDDDGDIEIVAGSRDGYIRMLTRQGTERWKTLIGAWITSVVIIPSFVVQEPGEEQAGASIPSGALSRDVYQPRPRILISTRNGQVWALDRHGNPVQSDNWPAWLEGGPAIHQLAVHAKHPQEVVVGREDHFVYLLDSTTGKKLSQYNLGRRIYGVDIADVDGDNDEEILAVSADKYIHILGRKVTANNTIELTERGKIKLLYKSYALATATLEVGISNNGQKNHLPKKQPAIIFSSDSGKDLRSWTIANQTREQPLTFTKTKHPRSPRQHTLHSRVLTIHTADINNDGQLEILVGSADHFLSIFDQREQLLWRQDFGHKIYSIFTCDYDEDGITEIIVGMGDNNIRACKIELDPQRSEPDSSYSSAANAQPRSTHLALYPQIQQTVQELRRLGIKELPVAPGDVFAELANNLGLLQAEEEKQGQKELAVANLLLEQNNYEAALSILLRLREQRVQHYWDAPLTNLGHIRALGFGDVKSNPIDEIIVGNDEGEFIALDINSKKKELWRSRPRTTSSVVSLSTNNPHPQKDYETTLSVLENHRLSYISNSGDALDLPAHLLEPEDQVTSLYVKTSLAEEVRYIEYIVLGLADQRICLYNAIQEQRQAIISTDQEISELYAGTILSQQQLDILAADAGHTVALYVQDINDPTHYTPRWRYQTRDRIRGLCAMDIDHDGHIEIVIGSEDRNVYVLNDLGELKWRYFMPDGVFSLDVCNLEQNKRGEYAILAGVDDGFIYVLNCWGDLRMQIPIGDRVRVVRAKDLHPQGSQDPHDNIMPDDLVEIAVATDDRLILFQYLPLDDIQTPIEKSWFYIRSGTNLRDKLYTYSDYTKQPDEYVRAFALKRLAGQKEEHLDEDFKHLRTAIANDPSPLVSQALAGAIVNLCRTSKGERDIRQSSQLLQQLARKPHRQTRIAIVGMLNELAKANKKLSFEYLKRFLRNEDLWLRRMVIRQLYNLVELDPEEVFSLLMTSTHDKELWILQETGRSLARYFDYRYRYSPQQCDPSDTGYTTPLYPPRTLLQDLHELLSTGIDVAVIQQIAISAEEPVIKQLFATYAHFQKAITDRLSNNPLDNSLESVQRGAKLNAFLEHKKAYQNDLTTFIAGLQNTMQLMPQVEDILVVYQELLNVLHVNNIDDIEQLQRKTVSEEMHMFRHFDTIDATLTRMLAVVDEIKRYRKREALRDQAATLLGAINLLIQIRYQYIDNQPSSSSKVLLSEDVLFRITLQQWYALLEHELSKLSGAAQLSIELIPNEVQRDETVELSFKLANTGKSAADAVRISIPEHSPDYEVIGSAERTLPEISTARVQTTSFILKPLAESFRLLTKVMYNDAEKHDRVQQQGHHIDLKPVRSEFKEIINPYHGGTPASDSRMFYGRKEDLRSLSEALSSTTTTANRIILLIGQRRSGKTSLLYQLENQLHPHIAVHIDLQSLALSNNAAELFSNIALKIQETMLVRGFSSPPLTELHFRENPTQTFDHYLKLCIQQLEGLRLILFLDEFEVFSELIRQNRLDENFMHYLRSLMQHRLGVNFLLAGAPHILLHEPNNRSALLNIAQQHHLSRLKPQEATDLITKPAHNLLYDPLALEFIHQLTGDQPYLIHLLCEELISYCNKQLKNYVNTNDIRKIIDKVLERGDNYFWMIWNLASLPEERLILALLAGYTGEEQSKIFSRADLKKAFSDLDCPYDTEKTRQALSHLNQEELIEMDNHGQIFSIPIDLTRIWLYRHTTPERIVRDEFNGRE